MTETHWASVGDTIECQLSYMCDYRVLRVQIETHEACARANELIAAGRWRVVTVEKENGK